MTDNQIKNDQDLLFIDTSYAAILYNMYKLHIDYSKIDQSFKEPKIRIWQAHTSSAFKSMLDKTRLKYNSSVTYSCQAYLALMSQFINPDEFQTLHIIGNEKIYVDILKEFITPKLTVNFWVYPDNSWNERVFQLPKNCILKDIVSLNGVGIKDGV